MEDSEEKVIDLISGTTTKKPLNDLFFRFAAALQEAAQVDKLIEEETGGEEVLEDRLPFLGVPLSVKESFSLQGNYYF